MSFCPATFPKRLLLLEGSPGLFKCGEFYPFEVIDWCLAVIEQESRPPQRHLKDMSKLFIEQMIPQWDEEPNRSTESAPLPANNCFYVRAAFCSSKKKIIEASNY